MGPRFCCLFTANHTTKPAFTDHYDAAHVGVGCGLDQATNCQPCPAASSLFLPTTESQRNKGVESCVCDAHFFGAKGTACAACPSNQIRPDFIDAATTLADCLCAPGFEPDPGAVNLCRQCPICTYKNNQPLKQARITTHHYSDYTTCRS